MTLSYYDASGALLTSPGQPSIMSISVMATSLQTTWTNMPAAVTELLGVAGRWRSHVDLTNFTEARLILTIGSVSGFAGSTMAVQYSTDSGSTWNYLDNSSAPSVAADGGANTSVVSSWITLNSSAKADVLIRIVGEGGDGIVDPRFGRIEVQFRKT